MNKVNNTYVGQISRSRAFMDANYRAACRAKSTRDFIYPLQVVEEETGETMFFPELPAEFNEKYKREMRAIYQETESILRIMVASIRTLQKKSDGPGRGQSKIKNLKPEINE